MSAELATGWRNVRADCGGAVSCDSQGGVRQLGRITMDELAQHNTKEDCWQAYGGKVYNVTPYLKFHPGGIPQLMKAAGKDGTFAPISWS